MPENKMMVPIELIESRILSIRGHRVMLDMDLAELYGVPTKRLNEQVRRNSERFPPDFMFQLTKDEKAEVVAKCDHLRKLKFSPNLPYVFTEHGAIMAASVLNTERAIEVSVYVVRAFIKLRQMLSSQKKLAQKLSELEQRLDSHDEAIQAIITAIRELMEPPHKEQKNKIGFKTQPKLITIK